uniref:uncharacterized protein LOC120327761 n=1 Tax=Styela clava TaxID=7725 RepID=UPI00193A070F|nr:uncharacterized protein LOC120327761 [Styela clava]
MQLLILLQLTIYFALVLSIRPRQCPKGLNDANTPRCVAMDGISDVEKNECRSAKHCCIGRNGSCYALPRKVVPTIDPDKTDEEMLSDAKDIMRSIKGKARFLNIGPFPSVLLPYGGEDPYPGFPQLPAFVCHKRPIFPDNCDMEDKKALRYTRNPPLNIPYCIRIPCDPDLPELDESRTKCREMPGCFFDVQLRDYRKKFGHSVMAGVPVCQLAIRNKVFLEEARKVKDKTGEWTPYLNECLLDTFDEIIRTNHEGCKTLEMLEYFKHKPKIAGWKGIKEYDCYLIAGCWMKKKCYYPVDVNNVTVSASPTEHDDKIPSALYYGRPPCQKFDDKNAKSAIESYHSCLVSGCKLDKHAQNSYYNYLFDFGKSMDPSDHWVFWRLVESGKYGAHNLDEYNLLPKQDVTVTPFSLVFNYPAKPGESNLIDELLRPGSSSLLDMIKTGSGLQVPQAHQNIRDRFLEDLQGIQTPCSTHLRRLGQDLVARQDINQRECQIIVPIAQLRIRI